VTTLALLAAFSLTLNSKAPCPDSSFGRNGSDVAVVRAAVRQLNLDFGPIVEQSYGFAASNFRIAADNVVVFERMDAFLDCRGIRNRALRSTLKREREAFVLDHKLPIYLNGELPPIAKMIGNFKNNPRSSFTFAHVFAHEWIHVILSTDADVEPYRIEVLLLQKWMSEDVGLHPLLQPELDSARLLLRQSQDEDARGATSTIYIPRTKRP
jgi:hypothetical protein